MDDFAVGDIGTATCQVIIADELIGPAGRR